MEATRATFRAMDTSTRMVAFTHDVLPLRVRPGGRLTDDGLFELCARNKGLRVERTGDGDLVILSRRGSEAGNRNFNLLGQLFAWVTANGGFGFDSSTGFLLPNGAERSPDAAWMSNERWLAVPDDRKSRFAPICPDLVVELVSPSDAHSKMREYIENGARLGWLIDRQARRVHVYRANGSVDVLDLPSWIDGEDVLKGFRLELTRIWWDERGLRSPCSTPSTARPDLRRLERYPVADLNHEPGTSNRWHPVHRADGLRLGGGEPRVFSGAPNHLMTAWARGLH